MTDREAIKFALEALEKDPVWQNAINNAQYFLRQALAQPEQEPVVWRKKVSGVWHYFDESTPFPCDDCEPLYEKH